MRLDRVFLVGDCLYMAQVFYVSKKDGTLLFRDFGGYESRNPSTMWAIQKADEKYKWSDFAEIAIHTGDYEANNSDYTYSKQGSYNNIIPDFNFHAWPEIGIHDYETFVKEIDTAGLHNYEINKVGWIGNTNTNFRRKQALEIANSHKELFDMFDMHWIKTGNIVMNSSKYISTPELAKRYSILMDIEGNGYSARVKHLLWSHRPVLLVDRPHKEFYYEFLKEWEHYIPVKRDLSDLVEKTKWCLENYDKALQIAENAYQFSKLHLTRDACYAQWNTLISRNM
jgi:hypothetical protein